MINMGIIYYNLGTLHINMGIVSIISFPKVLFTTKTLVSLKTKLVIAIFYILQACTKGTYDFPMQNFGTFHFCATSFLCISHFLIFFHLIVQKKRFGSFKNDLQMWHDQSLLSIVNQKIMILGYMHSAIMECIMNGRSFYSLHI